MRELIPSLANDLNINDKIFSNLYEQRMRLFEIFNICIDLSSYLLILSLKSTANIDHKAHLRLNSDLSGYGREAMLEMLVIRLRELFQAVDNKPEKFYFHGFHETLCKYGFKYPRPNLATNNAMARIIKRRNFYSAHHGDGKSAYSYSQNRLQSLDLITTVTYISKVEEKLHGAKVFDPFEVLLNDNLEVNKTLVIYSVYEVVSGMDPERFIKTGESTFLPSGFEIMKGDYEPTPSFLNYESNVHKELKTIRSKVEKILYSA